jgi:hypothetical protein
VGPPGLDLIPEPAPFWGQLDEGIFTGSRHGLQTPRKQPVITNASWKEGPSIAAALCFRVCRNKHPSGDPTRSPPNLTVRRLLQAKLRTTEDICARRIKLKRGETVVFSWIVFKSRAHRDRVNAKGMKDPRLSKMDPKSMPFDCKRTVYGGFKVLVDIRALPPDIRHQDCDDAAMCRKMRGQSKETPVFRVPYRGRVPVRPDPGRTARSCPRRCGEVRPHGGRCGGALLQAGGAGAPFHRVRACRLGERDFVSRLPSHPRSARRMVARGSLRAVCRLPAGNAEDRGEGWLRVYDLTSRGLPWPPSPYPLQGLRAGAQAAHDPALLARRGEGDPVRPGSRSRAKIMTDRSVQADRSEMPGYASYNKRMD